MKLTEEQITTAVSAIWRRLDMDIRGRSTVGDYWELIDDDVMQEELKPEWEKIIREEIEKLCQKNPSPTTSW